MMRTPSSLILSTAGPIMFKFRVCLSAKKFPQAIDSNARPRAHKHTSSFYLENEGFHCFQLLCGYGLIITNVVTILIIVTNFTHVIEGVP